MKDQRLLLKKSLLNNIPAIIFQGRDHCAPEILKSAAAIYQQNGCSVEFLYDFENLVNNFKSYHTEQKENLIIPDLNDSRDIKALIKCIYEDIPVVVFQGTDHCALEILKSAASIYQQNSYGKEFLSDFDSLMKDFEKYSQTNTNAIKLPDLSETEKDFVREDMKSDFENAVKNGNISRLAQMREQGYRPPLEAIKALSDSFSENTCVAVQKIFGIHLPDAQLKLNLFDYTDISCNLSRGVERSV